MSERHIVMVLGPGRSGTSSMAGSLVASGFNVPNPIKGNESNPLGFYEPRWMVDLHKEILADRKIGALDPDPELLDQMRKISPQNKARVAAWLAEGLAEFDQLVLKDPRLIWFYDLWVNAARDQGVEPTAIMMLRHPSEVAASRSLHYGAAEVAAVAGWINVALMTERITRGTKRRVVPYADLLVDWRDQYAKIGSTLDLTFTPAVTAEPHPIDEFIDGGLRRMPNGWEGTGIDEQLTGLADRTFDALEQLASGVENPELFDELSAEYAAMYGQAEAIMRSREQRTDQRARRQARTRAREEFAAQQPAPAVSPLRRVVRKIRSLRG